MKRQLSLALVLSSLTMGTAALGQENVLRKAEEKTKETIYHAVDKSKLVIDFDEGKAILSEGEKTDIRALFKSVDPKLSHNVVLAAWSDKSLPKDPKAELKKADKELATARLKAVESFLKEENLKGDVKAYNMAEQTGAVGRMLKTRDAEVKDAAKGVGNVTADHDAVAKILKDDGGPGKVVLVISDLARQEAH